MPVYSVTKRAIRQSVIKAAKMTDYWLHDTPTATSTSAVTFGQYANLWPSSHWVGGEIRGVDSSTAAVITKRIASYVSSTGVIAPVTSWTNALNSTNVEVMRAGLSFALVDDCIERAVRYLGTSFLIDKVDETIAWYADRQEYGSPSSWKAIYGVEFDHQRWGQDRFTTRTTNLTVRGLADVTARTRLAQRIYSNEQHRVGAIWLPLSTFGSATGTLTAGLYSETTSLPGTVLTNGTTTVAVSTLSANEVWTKFSFTNYPVLAPNTYYWLVLSTSASVDASNYVQWSYNSTTTGPAGSTAIYNGSSWSASTGGLLYRLSDPYATDWRPVWDVASVMTPNAATRTWRYKPLVGDEPDNSMPVRLLGQMPATELSADGTTCDANPEAVIALASANLLKAMANGDRGMLQTALVFEQDAERIAKQKKIGVREGALLVEVA
jgi:hypothetical protein